MPGQTRASFDRAIALLNFLQWRAGQLPGQTASKPRLEPHPPHPFNGGPGNCPAKPINMADYSDDWTDPSMEGRAIARPNWAATWRPRP